MLRIVFPLVLMIALLVAGCASSPTNTPAATPALPAATNEWNVKMTHSGGIMGLMRSIEVSSDGSYTITDRRTNKTVSGILSKDEISKLTKIVAGVENVASEKPNGNCADCFVYAIEIQSSGEKFTTQLDDISLSESGMEDLVTSLRALMDSALK